MTELGETTPKWTVLYNIVSSETAQWIGTGWEFFDDESDAQRCYERHNALGNCAGKRPYHKNDRVHLGAVHRILRDKGGDSSEQKRLASG